MYIYIYLFMTYPAAATTVHLQRKLLLISGLKASSSHYGKQLANDHFIKLKALISAALKRL